MKPESIEPHQDKNDLTRRKILGKIAKAGVVAVSAKPIASIAEGRVFTPDGKHVCSVSGMQSIASSLPTDYPICEGYSHGGYKNNERFWPPEFSVNGKLVGPEKKTNPIFNNAFPVDMTLSRALWQDSNPIVHWITALLNARNGQLGRLRNFPYTPEEVVAFYYSDKKLAALELFKLIVNK